MGYDITHGYYYYYTWSSLIARIPAPFHLSRLSVLHESHIASTEDGTTLAGGAVEAWIEVWFSKWLATCHRFFRSFLNHFVYEISSFGSCDLIENKSQHSFFPRYSSYSHVSNTIISPFLVILSIIPSFLFSFLLRPSSAFTLLLTVRGTGLFLISALMAMEGRGSVEHLQMGSVTVRSNCFTFLLSTHIIRCSRNCFLITSHTRTLPAYATV